MRACRKRTAHSSIGMPSTPARSIASGTGGRLAAAPMPSILDEPALAEGHEYFRLGGHAVSPDGRLLAYAVDTNGSERFVLKVRDLETGAELPDLIENWRYGLVWAADSRSFLYTDADEHWRSKTVWHHRLGDPQSADRAIYREPDEKFGVSIGRSQSRAFALISTGDHATNEVYLLPMDDFDSSARAGIAAQNGPAVQRRRARGHALHPRQRHASQFPRGDGAGVKARRLDRADRGQTTATTSSRSRASRTCWSSRSASTACRRSGCATTRAARSAMSRSRRRASSPRCRTIPSIASTGCASATSRW